MSDDKPKSGPDARPSSSPAGPPRLERVPAGYRPPPTARPPSAAATPPGAAPPRPAGAASYGLAAREIGADAAIAAGIPHRGVVAGEGALRLFALAAATRATGRLTLEPEGGSYALAFRRGGVEHAASSDAEDDVGRFLLRKGAVAADALARAELAKAAQGGDLVTALVAQQLVNAADVAPLLQEHGAQIVQRALAVESGAWSWDPQAAPPPGAFPLGAPFAMLCAAVRALDAGALQRRLGDRSERIASRVAGRIRVEDLRLTPQETRAAGWFDGARTPAEIAAASPGEALMVLRLALLLGEVELLAFAAPRKQGAGRPAPEPAPAPPATAPAAPPAASGPAPAAAPGAARPPAATRTVAPATPPKPAAVSAAAQKVAPKPAPPPASRAAAPATLDAPALEALRARLKDADYFTVLGVKQDAAGSQIKIAYFQLAKVYHPDAVPSDAPPDTRKLCADVFARVSEAWSVLGQDASRAAYLEKLKGGGTAEIDAMAIFQAENVFQDATLLVKARKYDEALRKLDDAIRLNADEPEFSMWKAWCEFVLAEDRKKKLAPASADVEAALRRNPRCAQGYLFLGQMAKLAGDVPLAEKQLKRGLQVAPEHAELQRELKYLRK